MANKMNPAPGSVVHGTMVEEFDDWTNLEALKGAKIVVNGWRIHESKYTAGKESATLDINITSDFLTSLGWTTEGKAVLSTLAVNEDNCPFECTVETRISKKNGKEYPVIIG